MIIANSTNLNPHSHMNNLELDAKRKQQIDSKNLLSLFGLLPVFYLDTAGIKYKYIVYVEDFKNVGKSFGLVDYHINPKPRLLQAGLGCDRNIIM